MVALRAVQASLVALVVVVRIPVVLAELARLDKAMREAQAEARLGIRAVVVAVQALSAQRALVRHRIRIPPAASALRPPSPGRRSPMRAEVEVAVPIAPRFLLEALAVVVLAELAGQRLLLAQPTQEVERAAAAPTAPRVVPVSSSSVTRPDHSMRPAVRLQPTARTRFTRLRRLDHLPYR